ncbi:MAG TPA: hypothetical protein ENL10_04805, partial [Candidatus Cloacimonetes bacterium]|nr:hypothetical protein [Candidatus Cloacimonadota bacterium]
MSTLKEIFESINPKISRADAARLMKEDGILHCSKATIVRVVNDAYKGREETIDAIALWIHLRAGETPEAETTKKEMISEDKPPEEK